MAKRKLVKLPKRIAGVKIPKSARKGPVIDFLNSSGGQVLLAEALVLATGVFAARRVGSGLTNGNDRPVPLQESAAAAAARLSFAFSEALRAFRSALSEAPIEAESDLNITPPSAETRIDKGSGLVDTEPERAKKKSRSARAEEPAASL